MNLIQHGASGPDVKFAQQRLKAHGFDVHPDGVFGAKTEAAVRSFQQGNNLPADGIVGDHTWNLLLIERRVIVPSAVKMLERERLMEMPHHDLIQNHVNERLLVVQEAIETLGWKEEPDGSNGGPQIDIFTKGYLAPADEKRYGKPAWCCLACCEWIRRGLGVKTWAETPFGRIGSVWGQLEPWAQKHRCFAKTSTMENLVGALFLMRRAGSASDVSSSSSAGHTGIVVGVQDGVIHTVEGNVGNAVSSCRHQKDDFTGYVQWWRALPR